MQIAGHSLNFAKLLLFVTVISLAPEKKVNILNNFPTFHLTKVI